jgi:pilus assembly protein CpaF
MSEELGGRRRHGRDDQQGAPVDAPEARHEPRRASSGSRIDHEFPLLEGIVTPRAQYPEWDYIVRSVREAFVDAGGNVTRGDDPLRRVKKFQELVTTLHKRDQRFSRAVSVGELPQLVQTLYDELFSMGVIGQYLKIPGLEEILLNGHERMFVKIKGVKHRVDSPFSSNSVALNFLQNVFQLLGDKPLNEENPLQSGTLPDAEHSRIQAIISPVSQIGPCFSIRKHSGSVITLEQYVAWDTFTEEFWDDVKRWVRMGLNIIVSGGTSTGKTSFLRVMLNEIPDEDRILLIEETPEIDLSHRSDILPLKPVGLSARDQQGTVDYRDLVHASLRMNPNRIVFGETRGAETWELLDALNTGHGGSMATVHAESPTRALKRLSTLAGMAFGAGADEQQRAIWDSIASTINIVIQLKREVVAGVEHRYVSEAWQFGDLEMFDRADPTIQGMLDQLQAAGVVRSIRAGQVVGWPLWERRPQKAAGQLVRRSDVVPMLGVQIDA